MHIEKVNYQKTFNLGNYSSEKIGVELCLNAGEDAKEALNAAKELVEEYHKENLVKLRESGLYQEEETVEVIEKVQPKTLNEKVKIFIDACKTVEELKAWELMSKNNLELHEYYDQKLRSIKK